MPTDKVAMFIRVDAELKQAIDAAAVREERSVNYVVTRAVKAWLAQNADAPAPAAKPTRRRLAVTPARSARALT